MSNPQPASIFASYFTPETLSDRYARDPSRAVDVIIPIIHTNEAWRANLHSIYREIPVHRLLLGDGGCIDNSIDIAREFPRVEVLNHRDFTSLGYSIRNLIEAVKTEWFVYLHSDVYLPAGWFEAMCARQHEFDWYECNQQITLLAEYLIDTTPIKRAYSGSQMGRTAAFAAVTPKIDDDYLYRNEDIIIAHLAQQAGLRYGKVGDTFHYHQVMYKPSTWKRRIRRVDVDLELAPDEEIRSHRTYAYGIIKYINPSDTTPDIVDSVRIAIARLIELQDTTIEDVNAWIDKINPIWKSQFVKAAPPPTNRRNANADRLIMVANHYRAWGARATVSFALGRLTRAVIRRGQRLTRTVLMRIQGGLLGGRGAMRRLKQISGEHGVGEAFRFLLRRVRGR